ncbi:GNAT family N-acetyltransferase [Tsukamurella paurometabola]|uniref:GNAT family N-acetyltransferase n=1 Tax=Tsukamurella paurometabola TaxID=2061 RepID=A0ABS5N9S1_TSUPA|nr:GNAT family N-acetyltransferase [Tsukamurella paurometabola]MBS4101008.1 GNAT family N-acetyltransferase [Tsukamurella paurometabola]
MTVIRPYRDADADSLRALFVRAGEGSPSGELWRHPASERAVYLDPYIEHCPASLFVAEADGALVGYLTGCPPGASLPSEDDRLVAALRRPAVLLRPATARFLGRAAFDLATVCRREPSASGELHDDRWPAHLHIDVAPEARGTGRGVRADGGLAGRARRRRLPPADAGGERPRGAVLRALRVRPVRPRSDGAGRAVPR